MIKWRTLCIVRSSSRDLLEDEGREVKVHITINKMC